MGSVQEAAAGHLAELQRLLISFADTERGYLCTISNLRQQLELQARDLFLAQTEAPRALEELRARMVADFEGYVAALDVQYRAEVYALEQQLQAERQAAHALASAGAAQPHQVFCPGDILLVSGTDEGAFFACTPQSGRLGESTFPADQPPKTAAWYRVKYHR